MKRWRLVFALVMVGVGGGVIASGADGVTSPFEFVVEQIDVLLLGVGAVMLLLALPSPQMLAGPFMVLAAGGAVLALRRDLVSPEDAWRLGGGAMVIGGSWLAFRDRRSDHDEPVRRIRAVLVPRSIRVPAGMRAPHHLSVLVAGTRVAIDLSMAKAARQLAIEIVVTCWLGKVELRVPEAWPVVAGRVSAAYGTKFVGRLDHDWPIQDVVTEDSTLDRLLQERRQRLKLEAAPASSAVVVHVLGRGGEIVLIGRD